jgi:hypothetical protein
MPESMNLPGLGLARLSYDAQVAALEQMGEARMPIRRRLRRELRMLRIGIEDKGPVAAFRWRGVPGENAGLARLLGVAEAVGSGGFLAGGVAGFAGVLRAAR